MAAQQLSASALGRKAGLAPNTVGNYLKAASGTPDGQPAPTSGKERSAKLTEVEMLAKALGVSAQQLLSNADAEARRIERVKTAVAQALQSDGEPVAELESESRKRANGS